MFKGVVETYITKLGNAKHSSMKLELLALKWAVNDVTEKFRSYLLGAELEVFTDNNLLSHLQRSKIGD